MVDFEHDVNTVPLKIPDKQCTALILRDPRLRLEGCKCPEIHALPDFSAAKLTVGALPAVVAVTRAVGAVPVDALGVTLAAPGGGCNPCRPHQQQHPQCPPPPPFPTESPHKYQQLRGHLASALPTLDRPPAVDAAAQLTPPPATLRLLWNKGAALNGNNSQSLLVF
jgi:hypothetical protein